MTATTSDLCSHVAAHAGVPLALAEQATRAVLAGLGATLTPAGRELVADELSAGLGSEILAGGSLAMPIEDAIEDAIEGPIEGQLRGLGATTGQARELIASVCRVLVEELSSEAVDALRVGVPAALAALLVAPVRDEPPPRPAHAPAGDRDTLAEGRPGSRHPLSEASGRAASHGALRGPQRGSIADDNPHAATKLSSAPVSAQDRPRETLAEGHPEARSPLSSGRS